MRMENISQITITGDGIALDGILGLPEQPKGAIVFAHGSGSGRFSPRNQFVARILEAGGFATLLLDLLSPDEADDRRKIFDIDLLADRLLLAQSWLQTHTPTRDLRTGYFGASTGAGAALQAAAREPDAVGAVVSRGGRPDLAGPYLSRVTAPTLLLVGGEDGPVIGMNEEALGQLTCHKRLMIIPGATHLFEEPGTLDQVAHEALSWFSRYLPPASRQAKEFLQ
ncbi:MAG: Hydrolase [Nitrospira sp.]|nr:MAG: Hydrolase [Nitrospira sp.]